MKKKTIALAALLVITSAIAVRAQHCGQERWAVKTGTDADVSKIDLAHPKKVTVNDLQQLHGGKPFTKAQLQQHEADRADPVELQSFTLDANIIAYKREGGPTGDSDFHIVLQDSSCPGSKAKCTVVIEIPLATCVATASGAGANRKFILDHITKARGDFEAFVTKDKPKNLNIEQKFRVTNTPVRVFGVGFFDFSHAQRGKAPNIVEIHPVLSITFK
jgi:hypothetical protein